MRKIYLILFGLLFFVGKSTAEAQTIYRYVKEVATGDGSGSSWANASDDLQAMINLSTNSNNVIIYLAAGIYKPIRRANDLNTITPNNRDNAFVLNKNVQLLGGYLGDNTNTRNIDLYKTILSGDIGVLNDSTDNCYHVVTCVVTSSSNTNTKLEGIVIKDGNANGTGQILVNGEPILRNNGGGVYCVKLSNLSNNFEIRSCTIENNTAINGGGLFTGGFTDSDCLIHDSKFLGNKATNGGALYVGGYNQAKANVQRCLFKNNTALLNGGAISIGDNNTKGLFTLNNSLIISNNANQGGGVYYADALSVNSILNSNFVKNNANIGSSVYTENNITPANLKIANCIVWGNILNNGDLVNINGPLNVTYSIVENGFSGIGNFSLDPLFTDPVNDDYTLQVYSPAINKGDNNSQQGAWDYNFDQRRIGLIVDIGAFESPYGVMTPNQDGIIFVNKNVNGGNGNGSSWQTATEELGYALLAARTNTAIKEIWVAKGTYYPTNYPEGTYGSTKYYAFLLVNNVKVYGGFQNANEININQRDSINLNTILSGDIGTVGNKYDNCYNVVISSGPVGDACLDGFIIRDGFGNINTIPTSIQVNGNNIFHREGAGLFVSKSNPTIKNCEITNNSAEKGFAGAVIIYNTTETVTFRNTIIKNNVGAHAGGIGLYEGILKMENCDIINNSAIENYGGGISIQGTYNSSAYFKNCKIKNNSAIKGGGGIYHSSKAETGIPNSRVFLSLESCIISDNSTQQNAGGGIYTQNTKVDHTFYHDILIKNTLISGNTAPKGGGVYISTRTNLFLINSTLTKNNGIGSIYAENNTYSSIVFKNTILWDNANNFELGGGSNTYQSFYSLIQNKNDFPSDGNLDGTNPSNDPLFRDILNGDFSLLSCSPAINTGSNSEYTNGGGNLLLDKDLANNPRVFDGTIDMGAYEAQIPFTNQIVPVFTQQTPICAGDNYTLPSISDNGINGTWSPAFDNSQTMTYSFVSNANQCASTNPVTMNVTVNPLDDATFDYASYALCQENTFVIPSNIATSGGVFSSTPGLVIDAGTGEIDLAASQPGNYVITHTVSQTCPSSTTRNFTIKNIPNANFTYSKQEYCSSGGNAIPTVTGTAGVFTAAPSGLIINSSTGLINLLSSSEGTYQITNTVAAEGNCPLDAKTTTLTVVKSPIANISLTNSVLKVDEVSGATYQWVKCPNNSAILGATGTTFTPDVQGSYRVRVTKGGCFTYSECKLVNILNTNDFITEEIKIYPNPANEVVYISAPIPVDITLITIEGKVLQIIKNAEKIDLRNISTGIYLVRIASKDGTFLKVERVVVY